MRVIAIAQRVISDSHRAAHALSHVLSGHLYMDAAWMRAFGAVDVEEAARFGKDPIERARLIATVRFDHVAVHRIAAPHHRVSFALHRTHQFGKAVLDLVVAITADQGLFDLVMPEAPDDKAALEADLNRLIACNMDVTEEWITDAELDAQPDLVKTMSVQPPRGSGQIRLVRIGVGPETADLQPCGGTHVANTSEIGAIRLGKIEKKGRQNRRVYLHLE